MYLEKLVIRAESDVIREIKFKNGLNLIIDETGSTSTDSGNNVGKTTLLRVVDFCLGGKKDGIYTDREFKRKNAKLFEHLTKKNFQFELTLKSKAGTAHSIVRPIDGKSVVDGIEQSSESKFSETLQKLLFNAIGGRPTLGQLMNKFIRVEDYQLSNALYFLHPTSDRSEYEALFMFLFGFRDTDVLGRKRKAVDRVKKLKNSLDESTNSVEGLEQQLHLLEKEISDLEQLRDSRDFIKGVDSELETIRKLQIEISELKSSVAKANIKYEMNREALRQLKESKAKIKMDSISSLYKQAKVELPDLRTKFEEVLTFHNQMIDNKSKFIDRILKGVEKALSDDRESLRLKLSEEALIVSAMANKGSLGEYDKINFQIQNKSRDKGIKEGLIQSLEALSADFTKSKNELDEVNREIETFERQFRNNLMRFNEYFSEFSNRLYGDKYYLTTKREHNKTTDNYLLDIGNMSENIGTGKKKAQISALDLAYLRYSEESDFVLPLFVLHDQLETVFENQIETLFEAANSMRGQFIVAVLSDKLRKIDKKEIASNCILRLSQNDKLFKVP